MEKDHITYMSSDGKKVTTKRKYTKFPYDLSDCSILSNEHGQMDKFLEVTNPFSGESYRLSPVEEAVYSVIMGAQYMPNYMTSPKLQQDVRKGLDWFRDNNAKAYMVLLD
jgi:hypothetical protein|tara:strand:+ start:6553 stop:6882 length:330 start_codon:yes stop_codon:yes gene_type:complete